jgi:site-specific DNA-methyltransferase (adenine-specific)
MEDITLLQGDNLELMKTIESNTIDLIYCDILYGTGRKFTDYQDLKPIRSEIESHYLPRIKEMHRILKSTGSIYLQMDTRIDHWLRCLLDDIFGYDNFRNEIAWCYTVIQKEGKYFPRKHDVILLYSKSDDYTFNTQYIPYKKSNKNNGVKSEDWETKYKEFDKRGKAVEDYWIDLPMLNSMSKERLGYDTQKPKELIRRFVLASSNEGDLVADFYMGSGTTAEVALELGRKFIGCDINPRAVELSKVRCGVFINNLV